MSADQLYLSERYFASYLNDAACHHSDAKFDVIVFPMMDTYALQPVMAGMMLNRRSGRAQYLQVRRSVSMLSCAGRGS